jgi:hypothetical protein
MRSTELIGLVVSLTFFYVIGGLYITDSHAGIFKEKSPHHRAHAVRAVKIITTPQRVCDWIGPGGRAVYRCSIVDPAPFVITQNALSQRSCDWVGPGGRAVYRCK